MGDAWTDIEPQKKQPDVLGSLGDSIGSAFQSTFVNPAQNAANALGSAINAVTSADDIGSGILAGAGELAKGGLSIVGGAAENLENIVSAAPEPVKDTASALLGAAPEIGKAAGRIGQSDDPLGEIGKMAAETGEGLKKGAEDFIEGTGRKLSDDISQGIGDYLENELGIDPNDLKTGFEGLLKAAGLGALNEVWSATTGAASHPISTTANTLEQLMSIDNKRSI